MSALHSFQIRRDPPFRPLLWLFGATQGRSRVELRGDALHTCFGWHQIEIPLDHVRAASRSQWAWYAGIGWRSNVRSILGLVGSYRGIVRLAIDPPVRVRLLAIPFGLRDLYVSLEDPDGFLEALYRERPDIERGP